MPYVSYYDLGATLYTPCTHQKLTELLQRGVANAPTMVLCLEDAVHEDHLPTALANLKHALAELDPTSDDFYRFIRPRNPLILAEILNYEHIEKVHGFVLPKFDLSTAHLYRQVIKENNGERFSYMPTLESEQVFDNAAMIQLRDSLPEWGKTLTCLRIGGNDLMSLLGLKRMRGMTVYDTPLRTVIDQLIVTFRPKGYELSSPVFDIIDDPVTLKKEIRMDLAYGFYSKTVIHPNQVDIIENAFLTYAENTTELVDSVLDDPDFAVFKLHGQMMEVSCHTRWAKRASRLARRYEN